MRDTLCSVTVDRDPQGDRDGSPRRLWVEFEPWRPAWLMPGQRYGRTLDPPPRAFGVTGLDAADCWELVRDALQEDPLPEVRAIVWDVDVSTLDLWREHMGNPAARGVWYAGTGPGRPRPRIP